MPAIVEVTCLCGKSRDSLELGSELPLQTTSCSCDDCRYTTGVLFLSTVRLLAEPTIVGTLTAYQSSERTTRYFCSTCGSHVLARRHRRDEWFLCTGSIDRVLDATGPIPSLEHIVEQQFIGHTRDGGLSACFATAETHGKHIQTFLGAPVPKYLDLTQNPPPWPSIERHCSPASVDQSGKLRAACHCGKVQYWVLRPNNASKTKCSSPFPDLLVPYYSNDSANPGNSSWWLRGAKYFAGTCACRSCRLGSGAAIQTWAFVPKVNLSSHSYGSGNEINFDYISGLQRFESSPGVYREFCNTCGATIFWHCDERPTLIDVSVGLLRAVEGSRAETWLEWHTERLSFKEQALDTQFAQDFETGLSALSKGATNRKSLPHAYSILKPVGGFRILILHPSPNYLDPLEGKLIDAAINDHPPFEALSYVWGDASQRGSILIEGETFTITSNLDTALRHIRYPTASRNLWVDSLCINQEDLQERSVHVQYMKDVYAHCSFDLLWLGPDATIIQKCLDAMSDFGTLMEMDEEYRIIDVRSKHEAALSAVFSDPPLWKRVWIMQEVAAAPDVLLVAGRETMSWDKVEEWLGTEQYVRRYGVPDAFHGPVSHDFGARTMFNYSIAYPQILSHQRRIMQGKIPSPEHGRRTNWGDSTMDVLARFRYTQATDPRDKIYALLGLMSARLDIDVDYTKSVPDVYTDVARKLMTSQQNLDLLCQGPWELGYGDAESIYERRTDLPSWCPDFSNPGQSRIMFAQRQMFSADNGMGLTELAPSISDHSLTLRGWSLGTLTYVGEGHGDKIQYSSRDFSVVDLVLEWMPNHLLQDAIDRGDSFLHQYIKPDKESTWLADKTLDAYWRTLSLDCNRTYSNSLHRITPDEMPILRRPFDQMLSEPQDEQRSLNKYEFQGGYWFEGQMGHLLRMCAKWAFAVDSEGRYCMAPQSSRTGDQVVVFKGAKVAVVLREERPGSADEGRWKWVGTCYVHEWMDGRAAEEMGEEALRNWTIV